jgi:hypothetical protein
VLVPFPNAQIQLVGPGALAGALLSLAREKSAIVNRQSTMLFSPLWLNRVMTEGKPIRLTEQVKAAG